MNVRQRSSLRRQSDEEVDVNLTPMLDVVFILLIFFIVTASFVKEAGIEVSRPAAESAVRQEHAAILIAIDARGGVWIDKRNVDPRAVRANVERLHLQNPQGSVVILADRASHNGVLVEVLDQVRLAGVEKIAIAATRDE